MSEFAEELIIRVKAEIGEAVATLKGLGEAAAGAGKQAGGLFDTMAAGSQKIYFMAQSVQMAAQGIQAFLGEAFEGEQASFRLGYALESAGYKAASYKTEMEDLSKTIQMQMGVADDVVQATTAQLLNQGRTIEQVKTIINAANNMAAATGEDFAGLAGKIGLTYEGIDQRLSRIIPQIKQLTPEQMKAGEAADLLGKKFAGAAEQASKLASVRWNVNKERINNILEDLGNKSVEAVDYFANSAKKFASDAHRLTQSVRMFFSGVAQELGISSRKLREWYVVSQEIFGDNYKLDRINDMMKNGDELEDAAKFMGATQEQIVKIKAIPHFESMDQVNKTIKRLFPDAKVVTVEMRLSAIGINAANAVIDTAIKIYQDLMNKKKPAVEAYDADKVREWYQMWVNAVREARALADAANRADTAVSQFFNDVNSNSLNPAIRDMEGLNATMTAAFDGNAAKIKALQDAISSGADLGGIMQSIAQDVNAGTPALSALLKMLAGIQKAKTDMKPMTDKIKDMEGMIRLAESIPAFPKAILEKARKELEDAKDALVPNYAEGANGTDVGKLASGQDPISVFTNALFNAAMQSESFAKAMNFVTETAGKIVAILDPILTDILGPILASLDPLAIALAAILQVIVLLDPIFKMLSIAIKVIATAFLSLYNYVIRPVANGIIKVFNAIFSAIDAIPFVSFKYRIKELEKVTFDQQDAAASSAEALAFVKAASEALSKEYERQKNKVRDLYNAQVDSSKRLYELGLIGMQQYIDQIDQYNQLRDDALAKLAASYEPQLEALNKLKTAIEAGDKGIIDAVLKTGGDITALLQLAGAANETVVWTDEEKSRRDSLLATLTYYQKNPGAMNAGVVSWEYIVKQLTELYKANGETFTAPTKPTTAGDGGVIPRSGRRTAAAQQQPLVLQFNIEGSVIAESNLEKTIVQALKRAGYRGIA